MTTTEKVNIGGFSFILEKDAYEYLGKYLSDIGEAYRRDPSSKEIVSDIEERIAELLLEKCGKDKVVDMAAAIEATGRIGSPKDLATEEEVRENGHKDDNRKSGEAKRLFRDIDNRVFGGVCSGIAAYIGIDTVLVRLVFILLFFLGAVSFGSMSGIMTLTYIILWVITPPARTVEEKCRMQGKPIELGQFKAAATNLGEEVSTSPGLKIFGKVTVSIIGILMVIIGLSGLLGTTVLAAVPEITEEIGFTAEGTITPDIYGIENFIDSFMTNIVAWWMLAGIAGLFSVWMLYNGVILTFHLKSPKWKPGLILFILWLVSILVFAGYLIHGLLTGLSLTI